MTWCDVLDANKRAGTALDYAVSAAIELGYQFVAHNDKIYFIDADGVRHATTLNPEYLGETPVDWAINVITHGSLARRETCAKCSGTGTIERGRMGYRDCPACSGRGF